MSLIPFSYSNSIGKTPGVSRAFISGWSKDVKKINLPQTVWPGIGLQPTFNVPQTLEVFSTDPNDAVGGTGMSTVQLGLRDFDYNSVTITVTLNGVTPVPVPGGPYIGMRVMNVGAIASFNTANLGDIIVRVVGGAMLDIMPAGYGHRKTCSHIVTQTETNDVLYLQAHIWHPTNNNVSAVLSTRQIFSNGALRKELQFTVQGSSPTPTIMGEGAVFISLPTKNYFSLEIEDISDNGVNVYASISILQWTLQARLSL